MPASDEDAEHTIRRAMNRRPTLDHNMVYVPGKNLKLRLFYAMPASDEDPEHTNGRPATRRPTLDHNMVYVPGKNLKLRPFYAHKKGAKRCKKCQTSPSQLDAGVG